MRKGVIQKNITKFTSGATKEIKDAIAIESPLEILLTQVEKKPFLRKKPVSITMRTPGNDQDLALGFLYTENIIRHFGMIKRIVEKDNQVEIILKDAQTIDLQKLQRHFYTSSSCGVCGKASIEAIETTQNIQFEAKEIQLNPDLMLSLQKKLLNEQTAFQDTGGIHAAALFNLDGQLLTLREDVGRHNAMDKLVGHFFQQDNIPLNQHILLLSGRASFELIQKAVMAGIQMVCAVGAPSSLAIELAEKHNITLVGFLNDDRFNVYSGVERFVWE